MKLLILFVLRSKSVFTENWKSRCSQSWENENSWEPWLLRTYHRMAAPSPSPWPDHIELLQAQRARIRNHTRIVPHSVHHLTTLFVLWNSVAPLAGRRLKREMKLKKLSIMKMFFTSAKFNFNNFVQSSFVWKLNYFQRLLRFFGFQNSLKKKFSIINQSKLPSNNASTSLSFSITKPISFRDKVGRVFHNANVYNCWDGSNKFILHHLRCKWSC